MLFLDDTQHCFQIDKKGKGKDILDLVFDFLDLRERDYFGLQFPHKPGEVVVSMLDLVDDSISSQNCSFQRWVDVNKSIKKQWNNAIRENDSVPFLEFKVKVSLLFGFF